jgi:hypothetical protein
MIVTLSFLLPELPSQSLSLVDTRHASSPSIEFALVNWAQSSKSGLGMSSHDSPSGRRT